MIVFHDTLGVYGGSLTLMVRMCRWLFEHDIKTAIICRKDTNTEIVNMLGNYHTQIICADLAKIKNGRDVFSKLSGQENIKVINFCWNFYLDVERIKKRYDFRFHNMIYAIHPATFKKGLGFHSDFLKKYSRKTYGRILRRMAANRAVIMMDEINLEEAETFFNTPIVPKPDIIRLPMYCTERADAENIIKKGFESSLIMTAARADFPYKGYLMGLIDDFVELKQEFPQLKLEIISAGDDRFQIERRIAALPDWMKKDVMLSGWMEYEKLQEKLAECMLFIGMGTSVLDAGLLYKPCIAVQFDTFDNLGSFLLSERPELLTAQPDCSDKAILLIKRMLRMNFSDYAAECCQTFSAIKKYYDIDINMRRMLGKKTKHRASLLSRYECARHAANMLLNNIRFRKENNSYENIQKI